MDSVIEPSLVDYSRQAAFDAEVRDQAWDIEHGNIVIIGCGGIGFWLGIFYAMSGHAKMITLFDKERIEPSNLNRLPVPQTWIGKYKVVCLEKLIHMLRPNISVVAVKTHITEDTKGIFKRTVSENGRTVVIDTTDDARAQKLIYDTIKDSADTGTVRYVKVGYEGHKIGAVRELNAWIPADYRPGYRTTNANAITSAVAAGLGFYKLVLGNLHDVKLDLKELVQQMPQPTPKKAATPRGRGVSVAAQAPPTATPAWAVETETTNDQEDD